MKVLALYLPQFHCIPENDEWWGKGFTEWTNMKKAKPLYEGHYQPRIPKNNNYYNLLEDDVKKWQVDLAKSHGIYGFCVYHTIFSVIRLGVLSNCQSFETFKSKFHHPHAPLSIIRH